MARTAISASELIRQILEEDQYVASHARKVFPVIEDSAALPYIVYRRAALNPVGPMKIRSHRAYSATVEVLCLTKTYTEGVDLAEAVAAALDGARGDTPDGLSLYSSELINGEESWVADAYVQSLYFDVKIQ